VKYVLLHAAPVPVETVFPALQGSQVEAREVRLARDLGVADRPTVFLLDPESRPAFPVDVLRAFVDAGGAVVAVGREGEADVPEALPAELMAGFVRHPPGPRSLLVAIRCVQFHAVTIRSDLSGGHRISGQPGEVGQEWSSDECLASCLDSVKSGPSLLATQRFEFLN